MNEIGPSEDGGQCVQAAAAPQDGEPAAGFLNDDDKGGVIPRTAAQMDRIIANHTAIMDHHDPERKVDLIVDEWGTWYATEPGTNPGFLYQQNSIRDALVAAMTLNIFNQHSRRVTMANIAQARAPWERVDRLLRVDR